MKGVYIIEALAEFIVIFGIGAVITYWLRGELEVSSLFTVAIIGFMILVIDKYRKEKSSS